METLLLAIQIVIGLGILNVWLVRYRKPTDWRGGNAKNMREEFKVYGLPVWFMGVIRFLKILLATLLIAGVWLSWLTKPAAFGMALLMLGAVAMHLKVRDPLKKSLPAFSLLILCLVVIFS